MWLVTAHAAERLIDRFDRTLSQGAAERILIEHLPSARRIRGRTRGGQEQWEFTFRGERVLVVAKWDSGIRRRVAVTVMTVETTGDVPDDEMDDMLKAYRRLLAGT